MGLDQQAGIFLRQPTGGIKLRLGGGDGEARTDGIFQPSLAMPSGDQCGRIVISGLRRVEQPVGRVAIHQRLAGGERHVAAGGLLEKAIECHRVNGRKGKAGGNAVTQQFVEKCLCSGFRNSALAVTLLLDEGIAVEPVEQILSVSRQHTVLGEMQMGVDEARQNKLAAIIDALKGCMGSGKIAAPAAPDDPAIAADDDGAIDDMADRAVARMAGIGSIIQQLAGQDFHAATI